MRNPHWKKKINHRAHGLTWHYSIHTATCVTNVGIYAHFYTESKHLPGTD